MAYRVTVYDRNIVTLIQVGEGARWIRSKAKAIERTARSIAPRRTGRLAASHVTLTAPGTNQYVKRWRISAQAYYAGWVHEGVPGRIYPKSKKMLKIPVRGHNWSGSWISKGFVLKDSVRGQQPNPWLDRAAKMHV